VLKRVTVLQGDYEETLAYANENSFFYLDPPYKPISKTASFNAYANSVFDDEEQIRLRNFCVNLTTAKAQWLLSNSDPKNIDPSDNFFDELFSQEQMYVERVKAKRAINSVPSKRGEIFEILVSNYEK
jgi:DNA adenine methylase